MKFYKDVRSTGDQALCARCQQPYATRLHMDDLIVVEQQLGYRYELPDNPVDHYQRICPVCRRKMFALAQGRLSAFTTEEP